MSKVLFLAESTSVEPALRRIAVTRAMLDAGLGVTVIDTEVNGCEAIANAVPGGPDLPCLSLVQTSVTGDAAAVVPRFPPRQDQKLFRPILGSLSFDTPFPTTTLIQALGLDGRRFLHDTLVRHARTFAPFLDAARALVARTAPDCVIYQVDYTYGVSAVVQAAQEAGVPVVSMQHGPGYTEAYNRLPVMADYYVAYNQSNVANLAAMGVSHRRIWLTGAPEIGDAPSTGMSDGFSQQGTRRSLGLPADRTVVLVALKPSRADFGTIFDSLNRTVIETIGDTLLPDDRYAIVFRRHPSDRLHPSGRVPLLSDEVRLQYAGRVWETESVDSIDPWLQAADLLVSFRSCAIVDAVEARVPTLVIDAEDHGLWPEWHQFPVFRMVPPQGLAAVLAEMRAGMLRLPSPSTRLREEFLRYFGLNRRPGNAARVAEAIAGLLAQS